MSHLPELGIGLANNLYPTACSVVPTKVAPAPAPPAQPTPPPAPPAVDATAPLLHRIAVLQEHCSALQQKCTALEAAWEDKCSECLNYERKLFVLEAAAAAAAPQPVFFPFQGSGAAPRPPRVEVVDEAPAPPPVICAAFVIDSSLNDSCVIYDQEPDVSLSHAFALAMDDPFAIPAVAPTPAAVAVAPTPAAIPAAVVPASSASTSTTRRVHMGDLMAPAAVAAANAAAARAPEVVAALAASVAAMTEKEVCKMSVETVAENLSVFGLVYTKPKLAAAKLLHATAKSFMASGTLP